jgi:hypothetical protein
VAAILWATAKFNLSANQKLAMPRKLKRLLLEMAKKTPFERPSIVIAKKVLIVSAVNHSIESTSIYSSFDQCVSNTIYVCNIFAF